MGNIHLTLYIHKVQLSTCSGEMSSFRSSGCDPLKDFVLREGRRESESQIDKHSFSKAWITSI